MDEPHYLGHRERLREHFRRAGFDGMDDYDAVELLLTFAIPRRNVREQAKALVRRFGSFRGVLDASEAELCAVDGVGPGAATTLRFIREAVNLYLKQRSREGFSLAEPGTLHEYLRARLGPLKIEQFRAIYLDTALRVIDDQALEDGTIDRAAVYPRQVMDAAIRKGAAGLIFAHNHPSGDPTPSEHDKVLTRALVLAAATLQVKVHDHVIVTPDRVLSFREEGLL